MKIAIVRNVKAPARETELSAGIDFFVPNDFPGDHWLLPNHDIIIPSGIHVQVPEGYCLIAMNKASTATAKGFQVGACVIDESCQDEIYLHVRNIGPEVQEIIPGEKLVQMLLVPISYQGVEIVEDLKDLYLKKPTKQYGKK